MSFKKKSESKTREFSNPSKPWTEKTNEDRVKEVYEGANLKKEKGMFLIKTSKLKDAKIIASDKKSESNAWKKALHSVL